MEFAHSDADIASLYEHYADEIAKRHLHPVTGAAGKKPKSLSGKAQLLNYYLYDPEIIFVWSETLTFAHLKIWLPYINQSRFRFAISGPSMKGKSHDDTGLVQTPIYAWDEGFEARSFLPVSRSLSSIVYAVNKAANNTFISTFPRHLHVHIHHGDSDKAGSFNRVDAIYDHLIVADSNAADRFRRGGVFLPQERFLPVGGTVVPGVTPATGAGDIKRVLYAPTFEGWSAAANFSSLVRAGDALKAHFETRPQDVAMRPHHAAGVRQAVYKDQSKHLASLSSVDLRDKAEQFNWSDAILSDVSGIISEYLFSNKPIITPLSSGDRWIRKHMKENGLLKYVYAWDYNETSLADFIASISDDPLRAARERRRTQLYFGVQSFEESLSLFDDAIEFLVLRKRMRNLLHNTQDFDAYTIMPDDVRLADLVRQIKDGKTMLRPTAIDVVAA